MKDSEKTKEQLVEELAASRDEVQSWRARFRTVPLQMYIWQRCEDDFVLVYHNQAAGDAPHDGIAKLLGSKANELHKDQQEIVAALEQCFQEQCVVRNERTYACKSADSVRHLLTTYAFVPPDLVIAHVDDITERQLTEEDRSQTEEQLRSLFEAMEEGVVLIDSEGIILRANRAAESILGLKHTDIEGRHYVDSGWEIVRPDGTRMPPEEMAGPQAMMTMRPVRDVLMGVKRTGNDISWINVNAVPLRNERGDLAGIVGTFTDITKRKRLESELKDAARFPNQNPNPVLRLDREGTIENGNPASQRLLDHWGCVIGERAPASICEITTAVLASAEPRTFDLELDGRTILFQVIPLPDTGHVNLYGTDISKHKRAEEALRLLQEINNAANRGATIADVTGMTVAGLRKIYGYPVCDVFLLDRDKKNLIIAASSIDGKIVRSVEKLTGLRVLGHAIPLYEGSLFDEVIRKKTAIVTEDMTQIFESFTANRLYKRLAPAVARLVGVRWVVRAPLIARGEVLGIIGVGKKEIGSDEDVEVLTWFASQAALTIGKLQAEDEATRLQLQLVQSQKMEAVGTLAGGVAHDMNNILAVVLGIGSVLENEMGPDDPRTHDVQEIISAARRGKALVENLLGFARKGQYQWERVSLNNTVRRLVEMLARSLPKSVTIKTVFHEELAAVEGDAAQLTQTLINLCLNASDAIDGPGTITISTSNETLGASDVAGLEAGRYVKLQVRDDGAGMDEETRTKAFEPFFTTKEVGKGTGLGLSMAYGVIENHGGTIQLDSSPGEGTAVNIWLPATEAKEAKKAKKASVPAATKHKHKVMLVDDEAMIRKLGERMLAALGCDVIVVDSGSSALDTYLNNASEIDLVLLDLSMPVMNGAECFKKLKEIDPNVRVLICTGHGKGKDTDNMLNNGALGVVRKPFDLEQLSESIATALSEDVTTDV